MGDGEENDVLNRFFEVVHMRRGHLSRDLKEVREHATKITPGGSFLAVELSLQSHEVVLVVQKTSKRLPWLEWSKPRKAIGIKLYEIFFVCIFLS